MLFLLFLNFLTVKKGESFKYLGKIFDFGMGLQLEEELEIDLKIICTKVTDLH